VSCRCQSDRSWQWTGGAKLRKLLKGTDMVWCYRHNVQGVGLFAQRHHVDQPMAQTSEGQGNSGDGLYHKQAQVDLGWWCVVAGCSMGAMGGGGGVLPCVAALVAWCVV
jgi:hypothetical protein